MTALFRILLIVTVIYLLIRFLNRYVVPYLFGPAEEKQKKKNMRRDEGEYIDYEEIE
jgi:hypothetical protein